MDFVKFAHDRNRMCNTQLGAGEGCKGCPLDQIMDRNSVCSVWCFANPEKAIEAVEQWTAEHPVKTRQSEFLKMFPGADVGETDGCLTLCPCNIYEKMRKECGAPNCSECRRKFWLAEVENAETH